MRQLHLMTHNSSFDIMFTAGKENWKKDDMVTLQDKKYCNF